MRDLPHRQNIRLKGFDYSSKGIYFITICVKDKHELLGSIDVGAIINRPQQSEMNVNRVILSEYGMITDCAIRAIPIHYSNVVVDKYVIMPNHIHMLLHVNDLESAGRLIIAPTSMSVVIQQLKRQISKQMGFSMWQKSYHDHIVRDEIDYLRISRYIDENPQKWLEDMYYVHRPIV